MLEPGQDVRGSLSWVSITDSIASFTRVCTYDRAGILWSEPGPGPRRSEVIAGELTDLLDRGGERGPFVLVGHSMGGIHIRNFAKLNRDQVAGFVFVDASHPDQMERLPPEVTGAPPVLLQVVVKFLNEIGFFRFITLGAPTPLGDEVNTILARFRPSSNVGSWAEFAAAEHSFRAFDDGADYGDVPVRVLTAAKRPPYAREELFARTLPVWIKLHEDLATLSSDGLHDVVSDATHYIHIDRPDVVVAALRDVVGAARGSETPGS